MAAFKVGLYVFFEALSVIYCLHYLYGESPRFDMSTICFVIIDEMIMLVTYLLNLEQTWSLLMYPIIVLYCGMRFGFEPKPILVNSILYIAIIGILQATIIILFYFVLDIKRTEQPDILFIINVIMFGFIIGMLRKFNLKKLSDILQSSEKLMMISFSVAGVGTILFLLNYKQNDGFISLFYAVLSICMILIVIVAIDMGKHKIKAREAEAELRIYKLYEPSFRELVEDIRARQHEFDNHINAIYSQHYNYKTYDELVAAQRKYCSEIVKENRYNKLLSHGDHAVTSFLYSRFLEAEKRGIEVSYRVCIEELECGVPVHKLVELLGNLVNNAMDEAEKSGKNKIYVTMLENQENIRIVVSNECEKVEYEKIDRFFEKGFSGKGENRGYGLYNVKKISKDYNIQISCENKNIESANVIVFSLIINKPL